MNSLRVTLLVLSTALHGAAGWWVFAPKQFENADIAVENGIIIEGLATFGEDSETVEAVEADPAETSQARPEIQEVKAKDVVEDTKVIESETGPVQETPPEEVKPVETPREQQVATIEQTAVDPVEAKVAASKVTAEGEATARRIYEGKLHTQIMKHTVRPKSGQRSGQVLVRFTIDPSGEVISREIAQTSGLPNIDAAALATIDRASPFPPAPAELASGLQVHTVPFRYRVE